MYASVEDVTIAVRTNLEQFKKAVGYGIATLVPDLYRNMIRLEFKIDEDDTNVLKIPIDFFMINRTTHTKRGDSYFIGLKDRDEIYSLMFNPVNNYRIDWIHYNKADGGTRKPLAHMDLDLLPHSHKKILIHVLDFILNVYRDLYEGQL